MNEIIALVEAKPTMKVLCAVPFRDKTITELDVSGRSLGVEGAVVIRRYLENNGALVSANLLNNKIGVEQAQYLATILEEHASLKSLCGNKGDETVLDMSGKMMGADGAIMLAAEIVANGALTSLNISSNRLGEYFNSSRGWISDMTGIKALAAAIPECK